MPSPGIPVDNGGATTNISTPLSLSAKNSLKRSRILYATNPHTAFIPTTDPTILQNSIDRRKRRIIRNQIHNRQKSGGDGTLAIVAAATDSGDSASELRMKPVSSSALTIQNKDVGKDVSKNKILKDKNQGGGILVVSFETLRHNGLMETS
jgi:hypothetical protein